MIVDFVQQMTRRIVKFMNLVLIGLILCTGATANADIIDSHMLKWWSYPPCDGECNSDPYFIEQTHHHPNFPQYFMYGFGKIEPGAIRLASEANGGFSRMIASVRDYYTVHGANIGETVTITAHLYVDGHIQRGLTPNFTEESGGGSVKARIAGDLKFDADANLYNSQFSFGYVEDSVALPTGVGALSQTVALDAAASFDVEVGQEFLLGYRIETYGVSGFIADLKDTGYVVFDLPEGITLTSRNGFGAAQAVPEPASGLLLVGAGILACASGSRNRSLRNQKIS